jgi:CheY-like chemotaxis protein
MKKTKSVKSAPQKRKDEISQSPARIPRILVAEDDVEMRRLLVTTLRNAGFETTECSDGYQLLDHLGNPVVSGEPDDFDLIVSDIRMPGITGIDVLKGMHESEWFVPMILITAFGNKEVHLQADELGAAAMFDKPFDIDELIAKIQQILVLDSDRGDNWSPRSAPADSSKRVEVDVVFSHMPHLNPVASRLQEAASILASLKEHILYCRAVIIGPNGGLTGRYHVQIMVTLSDKVFVVRSNLKSIRTEADLYSAIPTAFQVTLGKIQKHLEGKMN